MERLLEFAGEWLARAYALYGLGLLLIPAALFLDLLLLGALIWTTREHSRNRESWPWVPRIARRWLRLAIEIAFGLINPVLYLAIISQSIAVMQPGPEWWRAALHTGAWILLAAVWTLRIFGSALDPRLRSVRAGLRAVLAAALVWLLLYIAKDTWLLIQTEWNRLSAFTFILSILRIGPLYLIPAVLLWDYLQSIAATSTRYRDRQHRFYLLPDRAAAVAVACVAAVSLITIGLAAHRRSDASVSRLVSDYRESIRSAAARYDVDPRLIASIVYVTHRDQLSPFRGALERLVVTAWARNLRRDFGMRPPDGTGEGADENPLLNRAFDISIGLAQIKPRTAQTASVLATGRTPRDLPKPIFFSYQDAEPVGDGWLVNAAAAAPPIPVPAEKHTVAHALLDARSNLATCALILSLYQQQWETANRDWSIRKRPDILATLYQIGFARSRPHGAPRSNAFGSRVEQVYHQPWLAELLATPQPQAKGGP